MELLFGLVVFWAIFGIAAAVVGSNRGEGGCGWFAVGFLLGPIGFALAFTAGSQCPACRQKIASNATVCPYCHVQLVAQPAGTASRVHMVAEDDDTKQCPLCAERIKRAAKKCRYCGEFLYGACPHCGHRLTDDSGTCESCGKIVEIAAETSLPSPPESDLAPLPEEVSLGAEKPKPIFHPWRWIIAASAAILIVIGLGALTERVSPVERGFMASGETVFLSWKSLAEFYNAENADAALRRIRSQGDAFVLNEHDRFAVTDRQQNLGHKAVRIQITSGPRRGESGLIRCDGCPYW